MLQITTCLSNLCFGLYYINLEYQNDVKHQVSSIKAFKQILYASWAPKEFCKLHIALHCIAESPELVLPQKVSEDPTSMGFPQGRRARSSLGQNTKCVSLFSTKKYF